VTDANGRQEQQAKVSCGSAFLLNNGRLQLMLWWSWCRRRRWGQKCPADWALCHWDGTLGTHVMTLCRLRTHPLHAHRALRSSEASTACQYLQSHITVISKSPTCRECTQVNLPARLTLLISLLTYFIIN